MLSASMVLMALVFLGAEPKEGTDPNVQLNEILVDYDLNLESFLTEPACFTIGYHRGMVGFSYGDDQIPTADGKPVDALEKAIESGYSLGLEARELSAAPPPGVVFEAWKAGQIKNGEFDLWAKTLDLKSSGSRLSVAVTVGSGKDARVIPAGTPVDIIGHVEKDGVDHVIVTYDGLPLIIPSPADSPRVVSADVTISMATERKRRAPKTTADGAEPKAGKAGKATTRALTLQDMVVYIIEGKDGGPGPLQSDGQFASRLGAYANSLGLGEKVRTFLEKSDKHAPYYMMTYRPKFNNDGTVAARGRANVPALAAACLKIEARKYFLKNQGLTFEQRYAQIPQELRDRIAQAETSGLIYDVAAAAAALPVAATAPVAEPAAAAVEMPADPQATLNFTEPELEELQSEKDEADESEADESEADESEADESEADES